MRLDFGSAGLTPAVIATTVCPSKAVAPGIRSTRPAVGSKKDCLGAEEDSLTREPIVEVDGADGAGKLVLTTAGCIDRESSAKDDTDSVNDASINMEADGDDGSSALSDADAERGTKNGESIGCDGEWEAVGDGDGDGDMLFAVVVAGPGMKDFPPEGNLGLMRGSSLCCSSNSNAEFNSWR